MSVNINAGPTLKEAMAILTASGEAPALAPSKLGTKEHWDGVYEREVSNFNDYEDEGDVWFGEDSGEKMVDWMLKHVPSTPELRIVDMGCGNGHLLRLLARAGYTDLTGLDYSEASIEVATAIAAKYGDVVKFETRDLFDARKEGAEVYHVALDKGTLDGISLSAEEKEGVPLATLYPGKMSEMVGPGGIVLITSCNFTRPELEKRFITPETGLKYHSQIARPTFSFGGSGGQTITTIAFSK